MSYAAAAPPSWLSGYASLLCLANLIISTALATGTLHPGLIVTAVVLFDAVVVALVVWNIFRIGRTVLGMRQRRMTLWIIVDAFLSNTLLYVIVQMALWKLGASFDDFGIFTKTGNVHPFYALYDLSIFTFWLITSTGVYDNQPLHEAARTMVALELLFNSVMTYAFLAAAFSKYIGKRLKASTSSAKR